MNPNQPKPTAVNLSPCPFCGNVKPDLVEMVNSPGIFRVGCGKCGSYNNLSNGHERSVKQWNRRAFDPIFTVWIWKIAIALGRLTRSNQPPN